MQKNLYPNNLMEGIGREVRQSTRISFTDNKRDQKVIVLV